MFGWNVYEIDGHDFAQMEKTFNMIQESKEGKPSMIIAKTIKGKGIPHFEGKFESHYNSIDQTTKDTILAGMEQA
jgi:transketolase